MAIKFDGRKIRDEILAGLKNKIADLPVKPALAVIWIGDDKVSARYIEIKKKVAKDLGINAEVIKLSETVSQAETEKLIKNIKADGIVIQMPTPQTLDRQRLIELIPADKDIDGLRFCAGIDSDFQPPVILAILQALSDVDLKSKTLVVVGRGFLVGTPLTRILKNCAKQLRIADDQTPSLATLTSGADIIISAVGKPGIIQSDMIKTGAVVIDAGTTEMGGKLVGDIDPKAYEKSVFYTPVPGGIGPVTVAMLFKNLIK